jgi:starch synthase
MTGLLEHADARDARRPVDILRALRCARRRLRRSLKYTNRAIGAAGAVRQIRRHAAAYVKILFASSEAVPLVKTGGLGDVSGSLPVALRQLGHDVRLVLPAYPDAVARVTDLEPLGPLHVPGAPAEVRLLAGLLNGSTVPVYLVHAPGLFDRQGNPYVGPNGRDWPDNAWRFAVFCQAVTEIAVGRSGFGWRAELVHANDWQTGLVAPMLLAEPERPATLFTIHNLSYQGTFDRTTFDALGLPPAWWSADALEFWGAFSFLKGGIALSDVVTTVSPTYAWEIRQPHLGCGLEGLLNHRADRLYGILNGIDYDLWNPAGDPAIAQHYGPDSFPLKARNKTRLQRQFGLDARSDAMLFGHVGRLVEQKGVDLILAILPHLMAEPDTQLVILGSGDRVLEGKVRDAVASYPGRVGVHIGYDEPLSHMVEAGSDSFLMPSRFEPCGLNQLFSLRYGTVPIVHKTGGLADTVVDATLGNLRAGKATGFVFEHADPNGLWWAVGRALALWREASSGWEGLAVNGMRQDHSWQASARRYEELYTIARGYATDGAD